MADPITVCPDVTTTTCDDPNNIHNDGTTYQYTVVAFNSAGLLPGRLADFTSGSANAPPMKASDDPTGISNFTAAPTGADGTALLTFDLGASNGETSFVQCTVNGATCAGSPWTFTTAAHAHTQETVTGLGNGDASAFVLTACNSHTAQHDAYSGNPCKAAPNSPSIVSYGQYGAPVVTTTVAGNQVTWTASGNADGRNVNVHVTDSAGTYDQTFTPEGPKAWTLSQAFTLSPSTTDTVTATVTDTGTTPTVRTTTTATSNPAVTTAPLSIPSGPNCSVNNGNQTLSCSWGAALDKNAVTYHYTWAGGAADDGGHEQ